MDDETFSLWLQTQNEAASATQEKLITLIFVPLGWIYAAFLMID